MVLVLREVVYNKVTGFALPNCPFITPPKDEGSDSLFVVAIFVQKKTLAFYYVVRVILEFVCFSFFQSSKNRANPMSVRG